MSSIYDFDIDSYTEIELLSVLGIETPIDNLTNIDIVNCIRMKQYEMKKQNNTDSHDIKNINEFFINAGKKLLSYINNIKPVQLPPANYDILQSQNQLRGGQHSVTTDKVVPPVNVAEYKFPDGVLNPLARRTVTKVITIDSMFREKYDYTSSNKFNWNLSTSENKVVSMKLISVELPVMWYDIVDKNHANEITITLCNLKKYDFKPQVVTLYVPPGNYNNDDMEAVINKLFENNRKGLEYLIFDIDPTTTLSSIRLASDLDTNEERIYTNILDNTSDEYSPNFSFKVSFFDDSSYRKSGDSNFDDMNIMFCKTIGWYMGFRNTSYEITRNNTYTEYIRTTNPKHVYEAALVSETSFSGGRGNYIYVAVDDFNRNCLTETISSKTGNVFVGNNILGRISLNATSRDILINQASDRIFKQRDYLGPVSLRKFNISLLNRYGDLLDLNNNDFSIALELTILY